MSALDAVVVMASNSPAATKDNVVALASGADLKTSYYKGLARYGVATELPINIHTLHPDSLRSVTDTGFSVASRTSFVATYFC